MSKRGILHGDKRENMGTHLLIVESPAKAKTIGKYLGSDFTVKSSVGHIRDLPKSDKAIAIEKDGESHWSFEPKYEISEGKTKVISDLKAAVKKADDIYLASDPDREGEAIAWHLKQVLEPVAGKKPFRRVTYNEITKPAVLKAIAEPRDIDMPRVDAQQARRILDRLVGYKVSPLLWKYVQCPRSHTLSAGRVQSVALRLLVERKREIDAFKPETYYLLGVEAQKQKSPSFVAKLARLDGEKPDVRAKQEADNLLLDLAGAHLEVKGVAERPKTRHPYPPFTTSTLQQAASSVLAFSPGRTMKLAQSLYEKGFITYMRTDSVNVSEQARSAAKDFIVSEYGADYCPEKPNLYRSKADAQGAHEAIRPTDILRRPQSATALDAAELKLYDLVWRRFLASQMSDAKTLVRTVSLEPCKAALMHAYVFTASTTDILFEGFLKVMKLSPRKPSANGAEGDPDAGDEVETLPAMAEGDRLDVLRWLADEKQTKGPSFYSEASLVKALEENGVGRPSTYAQTIETLKLREYAVNDKRKLVPTERGVLVCDWLVKKLDSLFNVGYTARMEAELDKIEEKGEPMNDMLSDFYRDFLASLASCRDAAPDDAKFDTVFALLDQVKTWKEAKKVGKRVYDDRAFVESVRQQREEKRELSARQLEFLVRLVILYKEQIPDAERTLAEAGLVTSALNISQKADAEAVQYAFAQLDRITALEENPFIKSLREQVERGRALSQKQMAILARTVCENAAALPDADAVIGRLAEFVPGGFKPPSADPAVEHLLALFEHVKEWRPTVKKGRKVYDDKEFAESLREQYARRRTLSLRQNSALKRILGVYRDQIPNYEEEAAKYDLPLAKPEEDGKPDGQE